MRRPKTPLRLIDSPEQWAELDETIADCVRTICAKYDDEEQTRSLLTLVDLMTNPDYQHGDRETVASETRREAFRYTAECQEAQKAYMDGLVAPTQERKTA